MKVWASASAIGLSMAYFAVACSSSPPEETKPPSYGGQVGTAGSNSAAGADTTAGTSMGGSTPQGGTDSGAGAAPMAGAGGGSAGTTAMAGAGGASPSGCPAGVVGHCDPGATYPMYDGYTLALVEDFTNPLDLNTDPVWTWSDGSPQDGQTGFRESNISFANGKMLIKAESTCPAATSNSKCYPSRMSYGEAFNPNATATIEAMGVWSGELRTKYNNYRYGRYEVKFKAPIANPGQENSETLSGDYLSTMFVFRNPKNVDWNEIDIELEPLRPTQVNGNVVNAKGATGYPGGANWNVPTGIANYQINQEHVYSFNWTPTLIEWFVDGKSIKTYAGGNIPIPTLATKIMMNLWVFSGTAFGDGKNNKYPFTAEYDYFRFYKWSGETGGYPCSPTPACLNKTNGDYTKSAQNNPKEMNYGM